MNIKYAEHMQKEAHATLCKIAQETTSAGVWDSVMEYINKAKDWYTGQSNSTKSLINAGVGALGGGLMNKLMGGRFVNGALLGGIGGIAASDINWANIFNNNANKTDSDNHAAVAK